MADNYCGCKTLILCFKKNENGTNKVIYAVADEIRQPTNNNIKLDCCRTHKDMKDGKHQLGSMYTLELKKVILQTFSAIYTSSPGMNMQSVFRYITWILIADHRALLSNLVFKCAL